MDIEFIACPVCKQKLGIYSYVLEGDEVVCANLNCLTTLRIDKHKPLRVSVVPVQQTRNVDSRPESYG